jgi:hypothetical protein
VQGIEPASHCFLPQRSHLIDALTSRLVEFVAYQPDPVPIMETCMAQLRRVVIYTLS